MASTTPNRDYRVPDSTDAPNIYEDIQNLGNDVDADIAAINVAYFQPVDDTSIGTAASGFTDAGSNARTLLNGLLVQIRVIVVLTSTITATGGDVADTLMFTLDAAYRPQDLINVVVGDGHSTGEAIIASSDGKVTLRAGNAFTGGGTLRCCATFLRDV